MGKIAIIRITGQTHLNYDVNRALDDLRLYRRNYCVVLDSIKAGLLKKIKDHITWGEISEETHNLLIEKKAEPYNGPDKKSKYIVAGKKKIKPCFRLNSPLKGYGRKGVKVGFKQGGALGNRGDKINDLIRRMI